MLDNQPELQIIDVYVALSKTPKGKRVAYGSISFGVGERKILSKTFTVFRSERTGGLYVSWPTYIQQVEGKPVYKDYDMWIDVEEAKYWAQRVIDDTNRLLGVATIASSGTQASTETAPTETAPKARRVGWQKK